MAMADTTLQDRVVICELSQAGYSDRQIAERVGWSVAVVRKWRCRGQRQGRTGMSSRQGRPATGALGTFPPAVRDTLRAWRQAHPGWGPKTLRAELARDPAFAGQALPSRSSIARWVKESELTRTYHKHRELPHTTAPASQAPHEEWEMDARGYQWVPEVGVIALINVNDVFSKVKVMSYPCWLGEKRATRHPTTADYQLVLRLAFTEWGLPDRLAVDHDSVFYDNTSKSPFPTRFRLWSVALGVSLTFGRKHQPTDQALTERSHQTWYHQVLEGQSFPTLTALQQALVERRTFLNEHLPCSSLGELPPLVAFPQARTPRRLYRPEWETELLDLSRVHAYLAQGHWFRKSSAVGTVSLGGQVYYLGKQWSRQEVEITFDAQDQHLVFRLADEAHIKRLPTQGLTLSDLMAELDPLARLDQFQLALPFSWDDWRVLRLCETMGDTT